MPLLFSLVESPAHPDFSALYRRLGYTQQVLTSSRKAMAALKKQVPAVVVGEFFYGYGNNYAGANVSNLDVFLRALQKYSQDARVVVLVDKSEAKYVEKLQHLFEIHAVLVYPVAEREMEDALKRC